MIFTFLSIVSYFNISSFCVDTSTSCGNWVKQSGCYGENSEYLLSNCAASCGICENDCLDFSPLCYDWAKNGECYNNSEFMIRKCPVSCGVCSVECNDIINLSICSMWKENGYCETTSLGTKLCSKTCDVCKKSCIDTNVQCSMWAAAGECQNNTRFMLESCPYSCSVCQTNNCNDENTTSCALWKNNGECHSNPNPVLSICPDSCTVCRDICEDTSEMCYSWFMAGACENNSLVMNKKCPRSCGVCSELKGYHINSKDEL